MSDYVKTRRFGALASLSRRGMVMSAAAAVSSLLSARAREILAAQPSRTHSFLSMRSQVQDVAPLAAEVVQPNYETWLSIPRGATKSQVIELLGDPLTRRPPDRLVFGKIQFKHPACPASYEFIISFTDGRATDMDDPFGGCLSMTGVPVIPGIIGPDNNVHFRHFPRVVDLRWTPASGVYPIQYTVELEVGQPTPTRGKQREQRHDTVFASKIRFVTDVPYLATEFPSRGQGRWRVMGTNEKGDGDWTNYASFTFDALSK